MTCAKRQVFCILSGPGRDDLVVGSNHCYEPQSVCPREEGEGYLKCHTVCLQPAHAEISALRRSINQDIEVGGWTATIVGHDRICENCRLALSSHGIFDIKFHP